MLFASRARILSMRDDDDDCFISKLTGFRCHDDTSVLLRAHFIAASEIRAKRSRLISQSNTETRERQSFSNN